MHRRNLPITLFLGGDLMCARGIDQILSCPGDPLLHEAYVKDAGDYVQLAERRNGPIPRPAEFAYVWGVALAELRRRAPDLRLVNLETAVTRRGWPQPKGINYRMNPANLPLLAVVGIDGCALANNHVLDWGEVGLTDTLAHLDGHGVQHAGAGLDKDGAEAPATLPLPGGRLLLFAFATEDSSVPASWVAEAQRPGVARLENLSAGTLKLVSQRIRRFKRRGDRVVASIHWGGNWGFAIPDEQVGFAHGLIDDAGVDLVHGHSSHHIKAIEVYRQRLILYGCGDLLDDYEGIDGYGAYRGDLGLLYFADLDADGRLLGLELLPTRQQRLSIQRAEGADRQWLHDTLRRESARFGCSLRPTSENGFALVWRDPRH
ncbi:CapA family protein [Pseudomonas benzenivorans]|uniref:CapA family protein n=1 Tax=Pseudomonas benzenivorans TaxID=556533 RepID=A0ABY5H6C2_9PSED|nr:CapA family protein [Pseudomonas benzenivorans]UTW07860.1 CapA family protein [Pseudomonas benzenivorans]